MILKKKKYLHILFSWNANIFFTKSWQNPPILEVRKNRVLLSLIVFLFVQNRQGVIGHRVVYDPSEGVQQKYGSDDDDHDRTTIFGL